MNPYLALIAAAERDGSIRAEDAAELREILTTRIEAHAPAIASLFVGHLLHKGRCTEAFALAFAGLLSPRVCP